jgi:hypothetical protein
MTLKNDDKNYRSGPPPRVPERISVDYATRVERWGDATAPWTLAFKNVATAIAVLTTAYIAYQRWQSQA